MKLIPHRLTSNIHLGILSLSYLGTGLPARGKTVLYPLDS